MTLDFINVGYGDAILIRSGSFTMLVDCGDWTVGDGGPDSQRISGYAQKITRISGRIRTATVM